MIKLSWPSTLVLATVCGSITIGAVTKTWTEEWCGAERLQPFVTAGGCYVQHLMLEHVHTVSATPTGLVVMW